MDQPLASRTAPTPRIDAVQLNADIEATARFGGTGNGGVSRLTLTPEDKAVRDWFVARCIELGCRVDVDPIGNLFASYPGRNAALPVIMTGSHLDTQPGGGRYDGVLGVLAGLAALRALKSSGIVTEHPLTVVNWTNEEGSRFSPAMFGSGVHACLGSAIARIAIKIAFEEFHEVVPDYSRADQILPWMPSSTFLSPLVLNFNVH